MATFYEAMRAKEQISKNLLQRKDVFGVGVGYYDPKNRKKGAGIIIYSQKAKASIKAVSTNTSVNVKGKKVSVPIRVVKDDSFKANVANSSSPYTKRIRPVIAGYSVGTPFKSGTGGMIVTDNTGKNSLYLISNNHVLNNSNSFGYSVTLQPGGADKGKFPKDAIGRVYKFAKLKEKGNYIDAAISIPYKNSLLYPKYAKVGVVPGHYANYRVGWRMIKVGRTTGLVGGIVESVNTDVKVDYEGFGGLGEVVFRNQTIISSNKPISLPGDSGSVWLRSKNRYATAINYASTNNGKRSVSFPFHWAMQAFKLKVAKPGNKKGRVLRLNKHNHAYSRPLTKRELNTIEIIDDNFFF